MAIAFRRGGRRLYLHRPLSARRDSDGMAVDRTDIHRISSPLRHREHLLVRPTPHAASLCSDGGHRSRLYRLSASRRMSLYFCCGVRAGGDGGRHRPIRSCHHRSDRRYADAMASALAKRLAELVPVRDFIRGLDHRRRDYVRDASANELAPRIEDRGAGTDRTRSARHPGAHVVRDNSEIRACE